MEVEDTVDSQIGDQHLQLIRDFQNEVNSAIKQAVSWVCRPGDSRLRELTEMDRRLCSLHEVRRCIAALYGALLYRCLSSAP